MKKEDSTKTQGQKDIQEKATITIPNNEET